MDEPLRARTLGEALLYLRVRGATIDSVRRRDDRGRHYVRIDVQHEGVSKRFDFLLSHVDAGDLTHLGGGPPSDLLDPVDLVLFAARTERSLPATLEGRPPDLVREELREVALAAEAADEALKFIPRRADRVPLEAASTVAARWLYERDPDRFSRDRLLVLGDRLRRRMIWLQAHLRRHEEGSPSGSGAG